MLDPRDALSAAAKSALVACSNKETNQNRTQTTMLGLFCTHPGKQRVVACFDFYRAELLKLQTAGCAHALRQSSMCLLIVEIMATGFGCWRSLGRSVSTTVESFINSRPFKTRSIRKFIYFASV
jgi:hypothetical protein